MDESNPDNKTIPNSQGQTPENPPAAAPPRPGSVISSSPDTPPSGAPEPAGPPPQVVTSQPGGGKRWLKRLLVLLLAVVLVAGGWFLYDHFLKKKPATTGQSKDIPLLKIGMNSADYGDLYPNMSTNEYGYLVNSQMFEGLVHYENKSKIVPVLASKWTNPDSKTWVFTLKKGIKFHDGHTLSANDVKYSIDTINSSNKDLADIYTSTIDTVSVVDNSTVKITTKDPDPTLLNRLAFVYIIDANLPKGQNASMAGTGPYEIKPGTKPSSTSVQMVVADNYRGAPPRTKALDFGSKDDANALVKAFEAGQFNIVGPVPPSDAKKATNATQFISNEPNVDFLGMNTVKAGPLQKKEVREAIRYAVSPSAIGKAAGTQETPLSQAIPESIPGYNPAIKPYKQDIAKSKQLLAQAGYPNGLTLKLSTASDPKQAAEIVAELKAVGITVTVDQHADFDEFINYFTGGQAELYLVDYASDTLDGLDIYQSTIISDYYNNPKLTDLLDQASTENDPAKRLKLLQEAGSIVDQDAPIVPLYEENDVWLMDKNYAIKQDMPSAYISVYFSKVHLQ